MWELEWDEAEDGTESVLLGNETVAMEVARVGRARDGRWSVGFGPTLKAAWGETVHFTSRDEAEYVAGRVAGYVANVLNFAHVHVRDLA